MERTFDEDIGDLEELTEIIEKFSEILWKDLQKHDIHGRTLTLKIKYSDFQQITRSRTLPSYLESETQIAGTAKQMMRSVHTDGRKIRLLGITLSKLKHADLHDLSQDDQLSLDFK
jgi:DNA polymerase-4